MFVMSFYFVCRSTNYEKALSVIIQGFFAL